MTLPNFLLVGAAKAGTTALYQYLQQHPEICVPRSVKDTFFLCGYTPESFPGPGRQYGKAAIANLDDYARLFHPLPGQRAVGEACVAYLYEHAVTIPRIRQFLGPEVRILASLRHPAERAYSNYLHHVRDGIEPLPFREALAAEPERQRQGWWWGFQYTAVGYYYGQVKAYLDEFGRDRVLIFLYDDFAANPAGTLHNIFTFLGVDPTFAPRLDLRPNVSGVPKNRALHRFLAKPNPLKSLLKSWLPATWRERAGTGLRNRNLVKPPCPADVREDLIQKYAEDVGQLQDLIHRDLSGWLK